MKVYCEMCGEEMIQKSKRPKRFCGKYEDIESCVRKSQLLKIRESRKEKKIPEKQKSSSYISDWCIY